MSQRLFSLTAAALLFAAMGCGPETMQSERADAEDAEAVLDGTSADDAELPGTDDPLPRLLSETPFFSNVKETFKPRFTLFTAGAEKTREVVIPAGQVLRSDGQGGFDAPDGTWLFKTFSLGGERVETRVATRQQGRWHMSAYVWMGDDAVRVDDEEGLVTIDGHVIPAATDCLTCHGRTTSDGVLPAPAAFTPFMLDHDGAGLALSRLIASGRYLGEAPASLPSSLTDVETEAVGYLAINCGTCHRDDGAAAFTPLRLDIDPATGAPHVYEAVGKAASWGQPSLLIAAGSPEKSQVYARMRSDDGMRMPMFAPSAHDEAGIALVASFIAGLDTANVPRNTGAAR